MCVKLTTPRNEERPIKGEGRQKRKKKMGIRGLSFKGACACVHLCSSYGVKWGHEKAAGTRTKSILRFFLLHMPGGRGEGELQVFFAQQTSYNWVKCIVIHEKTAGKKFLQRFTVFHNSPRWSS